MNEPDKVIAIIVSETGRDPFTKGGAIECRGIKCADCPVYSPPPRGKTTTGCGATPELIAKTTIKTYEDAKQLYPELFL